MSKNQDRKKAKPEPKQKQGPATKENQKIKSAELTDADLEKVAGGGSQPHMIGTSTLFQK
jgi:hypothetical protein